MGKKEKLITRLKNNQKNFTVDDMQNLLELSGFEISHKGKKRDSYLKFNQGNVSIYLYISDHKELLRSQMRDILVVLERGDLL